MTDFDSLLKRSFAEAHEPADDGFSVQVSHAVARAERMAQVRSAAQTGAWAVAAAAIAYGVYGLAMSMAPEVVTSLGFGMLRAHQVITGPGANAMQVIGASLPQIFLITGVLAGGMVAYRATQE